MIQDGTAYFCASSDKPANDDDKENVNLPGAYIFPSRDNKQIKETLLDSVQRFVDNIGYKNGLLCFELIKSAGKIYIIEAQFRFGAKFQEVYLQKEYGIDQLEMLLRHALTGFFTGYDLEKSLKDGEFKKSYALMNILLCAGTIGFIQNDSEVVKFAGVDQYIPMKKVGDEIKPDGSMVQRFGKVSLSADNREELLSRMREFLAKIQIKDDQGRGMVIPSLNESYR